MFRGRQQTQNSEFSQFGVAHKPRQTRLPGDGESSFSSLDSDLAEGNYRSMKKTHTVSVTPEHSARKYQYLNADSHLKGSYRTPRPKEQSTLIKHGKSVSARLPEGEYFHHSRTTALPPPIPSAQHQLRMEQLLIQNESYRREMQQLRLSNTNIQQELRLNNQQMRRLRKEVQNNSRHAHQYTLHHQFKDRQLQSKLRDYELELKQTQTQKFHLQKKLQNERNRTSALQRQINHLRDKLSSFQRQLYQINIKEEQLKHTYSEVQEGHVKKIAALQKELAEARKASESTWKDSLINALIDMVEKVGRQEGHRFEAGASKKSKAKACWKYLKRLVVGPRGGPSAE